jgi:phage shock protein A
MGVLRRIVEMTKASVHEVLDQLENPSVMLNQYIRDMQREIERVESTLHAQQVEERRLQKQADEAWKAAREREEQAAEAVRQGKDDAAQQFIAEKIQYEQRAVEYTQLKDQCRQNIEAMQEQLTAMKAEWHRMKERRVSLVNRAETARAKINLNRISSGSPFSDASPFGKFEKMEERIAQWEAQAEISRSATGGIPSAAPAAGVADPAAVQAQLERLREQLAAESEQKQKA